ncbi:hypothetical protein V3851_17700 [Paenibacillus sp. M1]|uniref:Uncharacterized protein n=1 Tax=Paenibacillus haidiansis TaxID=1574488 RepID=A0ABU7VXM1_9BACL
MEQTKELLLESARASLSEMKECDLLSAVDYMDIVDLGELSLIAWRVI